MMHLQQVLPPIPFLLTSPREQQLLLLPGLRLLHLQIAGLQLSGLVVLMPLDEDLQHFIVSFEPGLL